MFRCLLFFYLLSCVICSEVAIIEHVQAERLPVTLDLVVQISTTEVSNDQSGAYVQFQRNMNALLNLLFTKIEEKYPESRYSISEHQITPYQNGCGIVRPFANFSSIDKQYTEIEHVNKDQTFQHDSGSYYSSVLFTVAKALTNFKLGWRKNAPDSKQHVVKIILFITNHWDSSMHISKNECSGPLSYTLRQQLKNSRVHLAGLVTNDVSCQWQNMFYDLDCYEYLRNFRWLSLEDVVLELISDIVEHDLNLIYSDNESPPTESANRIQTIVSNSSKVSISLVLISLILTTFIL